MLNFAQNLHHPSIFSSIKQWIATPPRGQTIEKWALFDGAILGEKLTNRLIKTLLPSDTYNVFEETVFSAYGSLSPHLVRLKAESSEHTLQVLLEHTQGLPSIAILNATSDVEMICNRLFWLANTSTSDGLAMYCRFADTRITGNLIELLCESQRSILRASIEQWQIVDRNGFLDTVLGRVDEFPAISTESGISVEAHEQLILTDVQYSSLINSAEADEIFQMLCEGAPDLVPDENRGLFHARLSKIVLAAREYGLEASSDIYQFSVIALATRDDFHTNPILNPSWKKITFGIGSFPSIVENWTDETWAELAGVNNPATIDAITIWGNK